LHILEVMCPNAHGHARRVELEASSLRCQLIGARPDAHSKMTGTIGVDHRYSAAGGDLQHLDGGGHWLTRAGVLAGSDDAASSEDGLTCHAGVSSATWGVVA
jgi:hypothetical protein